MRKLKDPKWYVRQHAAQSLGRLGIRRALPSLTRAHADPRRAVRQAAAEAVAQIG